MNELALFAGAGGGILASQLIGLRTVCAVEIDKYAASVLLARQNDKILSPFPVWDDVCTFDGRPWRGIVDVVSGGFPCQDISLAGRGEGISGARSGLWAEMARVVREVRPRFVFVENSPALVGRGLDVVLADLAKAGYDAEWCVLGADDVGAPHKRKRIWILAYSQSDRYGERRRSKNLSGQNGRQDKSLCSIASSSSSSASNLADTNSQRRNVRNNNKPRRQVLSNCYRGTTQDKQARHRWQLGVGTDGSVLPNANSSQCQRDGKSSRLPPQNTATISNSGWATEPDVGRVVDGMAARVDRVKALGNGQVPAVAATAFRLLLERFY